MKSYKKEIKNSMFIGNFVFCVVTSMIFAKTAYIHMPKIEWLILFIILPSVFVVVSYRNREKLIAKTNWIFQSIVSFLMITLIFIASIRMDVQDNTFSLFNVTLIVVILISLLIGLALEVIAIKDDFIRK